MTTDADLEWLWTQAEGDISGVHAAPLEPSTGGGGVPGISRQQSAAVTRYNRIQMALGGLDEREVRLLRLAHTPVPPALRPRFAKLGTLAHVVLDMAPSPEWVLEAKSAELTKLVAKARQKVTRAIAKFQKAHREWCALEARATDDRRHAAAEQRARRALAS